MSKYIIELGEDANMVQVISVTQNGNAYIDSTVYVEYLEQLNSDYINEHFGDLQDEAYDKGYAQCQDDYGDALKHAKDTAYQKGFEDGKAQREHDDKIEVGDEVEWDNDFTGDRFIVTRIYQPYGKKEQCDGIDDDGCVYHDVLMDDLEKTGRHFDIASILEAMKHD